MLGNDEVVCPIHTSGTIRLRLRYGVTSAGALEKRMPRRSSFRDGGGLIQPADRPLGEGSVRRSSEGA